MWLNNWEADLVQLGTAIKDPISGKVSIPEEQLTNIGNFDETCLSLDGSNNNRGGRPEYIIYDPRLPRPGKATSKCSLTTTLITGSTAAGEAFPPHLQFQTKAQTKETMRLDYDVGEHAPQVLGKFGTNAVRGWPVSFGANEKGGMDDEEFEKYLMNSIAPLFPNAKDTNGKRVIFKVDSGPGRMNLKLLARLRLLGFILYPCVPNTTHVTQETDQCYGPFKTQFFINLDDIVTARLEKKKSLSLPPKFVGLPLFGGIDRATGFSVQLGAFQKGFARKRCISSWEKVGVATKGGITRTCLDNSQVMKGLDNDAESDKEYNLMQTANDLAVQALARAGYDSQWLQVQLNENRKEEEVSITQPYTIERQNALATARTHGGLFKASLGGMHLTHDDLFISMEMNTRSKERLALEKEKKVRMAQEDIEKKALALLEQEGRTIEQYSVKDLDVLLGWHQLKITGWKKEQKLAKWKDVVESLKQPPQYNRWTEEEEERLVMLTTTNIGIMDTAYGRELALQERALCAAAEKMSREKRDELRQKLDKLDTDETLASLAETDTSSRIHSEAI